MAQILELPRDPEKIALLLRTKINQKVKLTAIGNSKRKIQDIAVDLINASEMPWGEIATGTFLSIGTIKNLATGKTTRPQAETVERIFRFFNFQIDLSSVAIKAGFANKPKG